MGLPRDHLATNTPETGIFQPEGRMRGALRTILILSLAILAQKVSTSIKLTDVTERFRASARSN